MDLDRALRISASGMQAQSTRLRVVAENLANRDSTGQSPGADPYRRKTVTFAGRVDRATGAESVAIARIGTDQAAFPQRHDPAHPAADERGYVKTPNVNSLIEMMDMREAQRSYEANLGVIEMSRSMLMNTIDLLRG